MPKGWKPRDVTMLVMLVGVIALRGVGINHVTEYILIGIAVATLGLDIPRPWKK